MGLFKKKEQKIKTFIEGKLQGDEPTKEQQLINENTKKLMAEYEAQAPAPVFVDEVPKKPMIAKGAYVEPIKINMLPIVLLLKIDEQGNITLARV